MDWILLAAGVPIVGLVLLQVCAATFASCKRFFSESSIQREDVQWINRRIAAADAAREENEEQKLRWKGYRKFVVDNKVDEGGGICSFYLKPHNKEKLPRFKPGQFLTFALSIPGLETEEVRCYSLSDAPSREYYRVSIKRLLGKDNFRGLVSNHFHDRIQKGDILDVEAPAGDFWMDPAIQKPAVLIGGGVGITPMVSMARAIANEGTGREAWLFYGVRNRDEHVMKDQIEALKQHKNIRVVICYSDCRDDQDRALCDEEGRISIDMFKRVLGTNNYRFFICGPPPMMQSMVEGLHEWGLHKQDVQFEAFGPCAVKWPGEEDEGGDLVCTDFDPNATFNVTFAKSGTTVQWDAASENLFALAKANNVKIDRGCLRGACGRCMVAVKDGQACYEKMPSAKFEDGCILTCVSRPRTDLVLDA